MVFMAATANVCSLKPHEEKLSSTCVSSTVLLSKVELARRREELLAELESDSPKKPEPDSAAKTRILSREEVLAALDDE